MYCNGLGYCAAGWLPNIGGTCFLSCWAVVNTIGNDFGIVLVKVFMFFAEAICEIQNLNVLLWYVLQTDSPASTTKNIVPQCLAHQQIQTTHFHATPTESFRGSSPCDRGSTSRKIVKKSTPRKLLFWTCSRGSKHAGRGSFAEGPAEGWPYVQVKYEGIKTKTQLRNTNVDHWQWSTAIDWWSTSIDWMLAKADPHSDGFYSAER